MKTYPPSPEELSKKQLETRVKELSIALEIVANVADSAKSALWKSDRAEAIRFSRDSHYIRSVLNGTRETKPE